MQITVRELIRQSMLMCNIVAPIQPLKPQQAEDGLFILNTVFERLNLQETLVTHSRVVTLPLVANTHIYSIGDTGNFNVERPSSIKSAYVRDSLGIDTPVSVIPYSLYESYEQKSMTSSQPEVLAYQPTSPLGTIYLYPVPTSTDTLRLELLSKFASVTLSDTLDLPEGYTELILGEMAPQICIQYERTSLLPSIKEMMTSAKALIKAKNSKNTKNPMTLDPMFINQPTGQYNPYTDS